MLVLLILFRDGMPYCLTSCFIGRTRVRFASMEPVVGLSELTLGMKDRPLVDGLACLA